MISRAVGIDGLLFFSWSRFSRDCCTHRCGHETRAVWGAIVGEDSGGRTPRKELLVSSTAAHNEFNPDASWQDDPASDDDIFGMARYLAEAVSHGDISEDDGETALCEWAASDPDVLERAARHLDRNSQEKSLLLAAYHHAA
jgi:hypothetical protein